jgi:hypothetical protein
MKVGRVKLKGPLGKTFLTSELHLWWSIDTRGIFLNGTLDAAPVIGHVSK